MKKQQELFSIRYRLIGDQEILRTIDAQEFETEFGGEGIPGDIQLRMGGDIIGSCREGDLPPEALGWEDIDRWLLDLLHVVERLEEKAQSAAFRMIEYDNRWLTFFVQNEAVVIRTARCLDESCAREQFLTEPACSFDYREPCDHAVPYTAFKEGVLACVQRFLCEIQDLNPALCKTAVITAISQKYTQYCEK